jgi:hypothetical protein
MKKKKETHSMILFSNSAATWCFFPVFIFNCLETVFLLLNVLEQYVETFFLFFMLGIHIFK